MAGIYTAHIDDGTVVDHSSRSVVVGVVVGACHCLVHPLGKVTVDGSLQISPTETVTQLQGEDVFVYGFGIYLVRSSRLQEGSTREVGCSADITCIDEYIVICGKVVVETAFHGISQEVERLRASVFGIVVSLDRKSVV